jgi:hypothetical protein
MSGIKEIPVPDLGTKKKLRSIIDIPVKVEMQPIEHQTDSVLTTDELQQQIEEAKRGKAKVDSKYVGFQLEERGHLFDYEFDYAKFLDNMSHIIKEGKRRRAEKAEDLYKEKIKMFNSPTTEKKRFD